MRTKRLTKMSLLTAIALTIFIFEAQIPVIIPVPGVKMGLANIINIYAVFVLGPADALCILLCRIFLGSAFSGQIMVLLYSLGGGLLCYLAMLLMRRFLTLKEIWVAGIVGAIVHNTGQILVAAVVMKTVSIFYYLPVLLISGIFAGLLTGLSAQFLINHMSLIGKIDSNGGDKRKIFKLKD
ncbi:heptaprenyl diphosphate synthase [Ruminiclostridium sufflavum DSM 19573]|uniref:Heptaprenyl diphosphate synthase n=1 Tax=Ruminiclostridium sufflavum DSM 19573 TaxID=1121337 RepID=A0A318XI29_9FIRM|nr:Gx transporter family protein [Ruminiclostridium sufflavum]PYG86684.1 heptaprenyl diphosphate synthase [Ruminiclostridium sufflavum DSM 19573]